MRILTTIALMALAAGAAGAAIPEAPALPAPTLAQQQASAAAASREGRWADALKLWRAVEEKRPNDPGATAELGWALLETGSTADARRRFQRALHLEPNHVRAQAGLVAIAIRARKPEEAVKIALETARARPESAEAFLILGDAQKAAARRLESEDAYRRAVALDPNDARARAGLASVLFIRSKADEAIKEYRVANQLDPGNAAYLEALGRAALQGGRPSEAASAFASAMDALRRAETPWERLDALALSALDALGRAASAALNNVEPRQDAYEANRRILEVADALSELPALAAMDATVSPAMAQRALGYGLMGQAAALDMSAFRGEESASANDAFVLREQARRAFQAARAASQAPTPEKR